MKRLIKSMLLSALLAVSVQSQAAIINAEIDQGVSETVTGDSGWLNEDTFSDSLDFYVLTLNDLSDVGIQITADIAFGLSIYAGEISNDFGIVFDNDGDFFDFFTDLTYIDGLSPFLPGFGNDEFQVSLAAGIYTIAVGGNEGLFDDLGQYAYSIEFTQLNPPNGVNTPALFALFCLCLSALVYRSRFNYNA